MGNAAGQLTHCIHFLHLPQIFLGHRAIGRFLFQLLIGIRQFSGARRDRGLHPVGALRFYLRHAPRIASVCISGVGDPQREQHADQQDQPEQARRLADPFGAVARQRYGDAAFLQTRIFGPDDAIQQDGDLLQVG